MPIYEYKCSACSDVFEEMHGVNETVSCCPRCGGRVRRLFHPVGIIFKGSGFYKTDSRAASDNGGDKASPGKAEREKVEGKSSAAGESTPKDDAGT